MAEEILGEGVVKVRVEDDTAAELARIRAEYHRAMQALDREDATVRVKGNLDDLKKTLREAEALQKAHNDKIAKMEEERGKLSGAEKGALTRRINAEKGISEEIDNQNGLLRDRLKLAQTQYNQQVRTEKELQAGEKRRRVAAKAETEENKLKLKAWKDQQRELEKMNRAQAQALIMDKRRTEQIQKAAASEQQNAQRMGRLHSQALAMDKKRTDDALRQAQRRETSFRREADNVGKIQEQYIKAQREFQKAQREKPGRFATREQHIDVKLRTKNAEREMLGLRARLTALGAKPIEVHTKVERRGFEQVTTGLGNMIEKLTSARVTFGPFSTSLRALLILLASMAPIVTGLVGALGALVGVIGGGLIGALGVVGAGAAGFGLALVGIGTAVFPVIKGLQQAHKATLKYDQAVAQYGKGSKQAITAQKQMNSVLAQVDPNARKAIRSWDRIKQSWKDMTGPAAGRAVGQVLNDTFKTLGSDLPMFAHRTNDALAAVSKGWGKWMAGLRSPEGKAILGDLFKNFNSSIPHFMSGLGSLGTALGRVFQSFSHFLPQLSIGFAHWARSLADAAGHTGPLNAKVHTLVNALQSVGHFAQAAASWLGALFGPSIRPGIGFLDDMTNGLDKAAAHMRTLSGQSHLADFFKESIATTEKFYNALAPLIELFVKWSTVFRPFTDAALAVLDVLGKFTSGLAGLKAFRTAFQAAFSAYIVYRMARGILVATKAFNGLRIAAIEAFAAMRGAGVANTLKGLFTGKTTAGLGAAGEIEAAFATGGTTAAGEIEAAFATGGALAAAEIRGAGAVGAGASALGSGLGIGGAEAVGGGAAAAAGEVTGLEVAAGGAAGGIAGLGAAGTIAATGGLALLAGAAIYAVIKLTDHKTAAEKLTDSLKKVEQTTSGLKDTTKAYSDTFGPLATQTKSYDQTIKSMNANKAHLNRLEQTGKKNTDDYRNTLSNLNTQFQQRDRFEKLREQTYSRQLTLGSKIVSMELQHRNATGAYNEAVKQQRDAQDAYNLALKQGGVAAVDATGAGQRLAQANENLAHAHADLLSQQRAINTALNVNAASMLNFQRVTQGMIAVTGTAEQALGRLARKQPKIAAKIALTNPDPRDVQRVSNQASRALGAGVSAKQVFKIVADASSAQQAIRRLQAVSFDPKLLHIITSGDKQALQVLSTIAGRKLTRKEQNIVQSGGPAVLRLLGTILHLHIPNKVFAIVAHDAASAEIAHLNSLQLTPKVQNIYQVLHTAGAGPTQPHGGAAQGATGGVSDRTTKQMFGAWNMVGGQTMGASGRSGRYSRPRLLVGEENSTEFVIATNPAYRQSNIAYLKQAAGMLGVETAAKGKAPQPKKIAKGDTTPPKGYHRGKVKVGKTNQDRWVPNSWVHDDAAGVDVAPDKYRFHNPHYTAKQFRTGAVDSGVADDIITKFRTAATHISTLTKELASARDDKKHVTGTAKQKAAKVKTINARIGKLTRELGKAKKAQIKLAPKYNLAQADKARLGQFGQYVDDIAADDNKMNDAETGGDLEGWNAAKDKKSADLNSYISLLTTAFNNAPAGDWKAQLGRDLAGAKSDLVTLGNTQFQGSTSAEARLTPGQVDQLRKIQADVALEGAGQADFYTDAWSGLIRDGQAATAVNALRDFWTDRLTEAKTSGAPPEVIAAIAANIGSGDSGGSAVAGPTQGQLYETERTNLLRDFASNVYGPGVGSPAGVASAIGGMTTNPALLAGTPDVGGALAAGGAVTRALSGGATAAAQVSSVKAPSTSKTVNVTNNYAAPPEDPHTWSQGVAFEMGAAL